MQGRVHTLNHVFFTLALVGSVHVQAPTALPLGKEPRYQVDRRLGQNRFGRRGEEKKSCPRRDSDLSAVQQITSRYSNYAIPFLTVVY
jgi:hypothetical protein